jgi:hypothetical protein
MGLAGFERNVEALAAEKARQDKTQAEQGANADMLYLFEGQTQLRILPPYSAEGVFFKEVWKHRVKLSADDIFTGVCPESMNLGDCAICAKGEELYATKDETAMEIAKELKARRYYLYNVIAFSGPANKKGETPTLGKVYCLENGVMVHRQIMELDQDPAAGWADITAIPNGVNLVIKRTGKGLDTKYAVNPHGAGRTDIFAYLRDTAKVNPESLTLFNLDEVYVFDPEKNIEVAARIKGPRAPAPEPTFAAPTPVAVAPAPAAPAVAPSITIGAPPPATVTAPAMVPVPTTITAPATVAVPTIPAPPTKE